MTEWKAEDDFAGSAVGNGQTTGKKPCDLVVWAFRTGKHCKQLEPWETAQRHVYRTFEKMLRHYAVSTSVAR